MRKLILFMSMSLDGFIGGPDEADNTADDSPDDHRFANELFAATDMVLFGRVTYEGFIGYWDTLDLSDASVPPVEVEFARIFRRLKRVVFSRTLAQVADHTLLIRDDLANSVMALKQQSDKDLLLICGPELLVTLIDLNLVDEMQLLISPAVLGHGQSLFGNLSKSIRLRLVATRTFDSGSVLHHYQTSFPS